MARTALQPNDVKIEQKDPISEEKLSKDTRGSDIVQADDSLVDKDYMASLAFMDEPVTILIHPSSERNAPMAYHCTVNGRNPEILINGRWRTYPSAHLPVSQEMTIKRKFLEVLIRAKIDTITTSPTKMETDASDDIDNKVIRHTSALCNVQIIKDESPRSSAWMTELRRRNY